MTPRVRITEVAPRDGLQNEPGRIATPEKARLVRALAAAGVDEVEITSFVSPKWIPQLGDAAELCALLAPDKPAGVIYSALVPNERGMESLLSANAAAGFALIDKASVFTAASETFSQKNTNASIAETIERFRPVAARARGAGLALRAYISCVVACPYEGPVAPQAVAEVAGHLIDLGAGEIDLGDTIGAGTPETIAAVLHAVLPHCRRAGVDCVLHLHDTFGRAAECVRTALDLGVRSFDAAVGGLGGCPYASTPGRRAPGNIATNALLDAVEAAGLTHGVDRAALSRAERIAAEVLAGGGP